MIEELLPPGVRTAEAFADIPGEVPFPGEEDLIDGAAQIRRGEFITARRCARRALADLGRPAGPIRSGTKRQPIWPDGVVGSITHCVGYRAAAVAERGELDSLGIDAEPHGPLPDGVCEAVTLVEERAMLERLALSAPDLHWDRLLFSAKESVYKAWYPLTGRWLGFEDAHLTFDPAGSSFRALLLIDGTRADSGPPLVELGGRFLVARGLVLTAATILRS